MIRYFNFLTLIKIQTCFSPLKKDCFIQTKYTKKTHVCKGGFDWETKNFNPYTRKTTLQKIPRSGFILWIMSRYSNSVGRKRTQFWFVPSECQTNPLNFNRKAGLHNHMLRSLVSNSDFPIPPKLAHDNVKSFPSNCFFFVITSLKPSIRFPFEIFRVVAQPWKKDPYLGWVKRKIVWRCSQNSTLIIWIMSRYSRSFCTKSTQIWFVPSECPSSPLHFNRQTWLHNHILLSLMGNSDFLIRPKLAIDSVKSWPSNCFFFVTSSIKSSIGLPIENLLLVVQLWRKTRLWAESKAKLTESAQKFQLFVSH